MNDELRDRVNELLHLGIAASTDRANGVELRPTDPVHVCETACTHVIDGGWTALGVANVFARRAQAIES